MARSASIWILCFGTWTKSCPKTTLVDILRGIDRDTFLQKSEKSAQKGVQKQGPIWSSYHSLIAICEGYFSEPWTNFENFTEAYTNLSKVHDCTHRWNSLKVLTERRTDGRTNISIWSSRKGNKRFAQKCIIHQTKNVLKVLTILSESQTGIGFRKVPNSSSEQ